MMTVVEYYFKVNMTIVSKWKLNYNILGAWIFKLLLLLLFLLLVIGQAHEYKQNLHEIVINKVCTTNVNKNEYDLSRKKFDSILFFFINIHILKVMRHNENRFLHERNTDLTTANENYKILKYRRHRYYYKYLYTSIPTEM